MFNQKLMKSVWNNSIFPFSVMSDQNHNGVKCPGVLREVGKSLASRNDKNSNGRGEETIGATEMAWSINNIN